MAIYEMFVYLKYAMCSVFCKKKKEVELDELTSNDENAVMYDYV